MKNIFNILSSLFAFSIVLVLASCANDEDANPIQTGIVGEWTFSELAHDTKINGDDFKTYLQQNHGLSDEEAEALEAPYLDNLTQEDFEGNVIILNDDNSYIIQEGSHEERGTYLFEEEEARLSFISDSEVNVFEVVELGNQSMTLNFIIEFSEDITEDGEEENIEVFHLMTFVR